MPAFALSKTKIYLPVVIYSTQDNEKLLQQLISGFKRTTTRNKYQSKATIQERNQCSYLIDPSFQMINSYFVLSFENNTGQTSYKKCYLSRVQIKN